LRWIDSIATRQPTSHAQIDDLLEDAGVSVSGEGAVHWVDLLHEGLALYPTADQLREEGSTADCAAAFVPLSMLASSSDVSSNG